MQPVNATINLYLQQFRNETSQRNSPERLQQSTLKADASPKKLNLNLINGQQQQHYFSTASFSQVVNTNNGMTAIIIGQNPATNRSTENHCGVETVNKGQTTDERGENIERNKDMTDGEFESPRVRINDEEEGRSTSKSNGGPSLDRLKFVAQRGQTIPALSIIGRQNAP